jgi:hypothetical protein
MASSMMLSSGKEHTQSDSAMDMSTYGYQERNPAQRLSRSKQRVMENEMQLSVDILIVLPMLSQNYVDEI